MNSEEDELTTQQEYIATEIKAIKEEDAKRAEKD